MTLDDGMTRIDDDDSLDDLDLDELPVMPGGGGGGGGDIRAAFAALDLGSDLVVRDEETRTILVSSRKLDREDIQILAESFGQRLLPIRGIKRPKGFEDGSVIALSKDTWIPKHFLSTDEQKRIRNLYSGNNL